jgi:hypothetical protein
MEKTRRGGKAGLKRRRVLQGDFADHRPVAGSHNNTEIVWVAVISRQVAGYFQSHLARGFVVSKIFSIVFGELATIFQAEKIVSHGQAG